MDEKQMAAIQDHMDAQQVVVRNIGEKVEVSQMELIILSNCTLLGLLEIFSHLDGESGKGERAEIEQLKQAIRRDFSKDGDDGLNRLAQSAVAMLSGERFGPYVVEVDE